VERERRERVERERRERRERREETTFNAALLRPQSSKGRGRVRRGGAAGAACAAAVFTDGVGGVGRSSAATGNSPSREALAAAM